MRKYRKRGGSQPQIVRADRNSRLRETTEMTTASRRNGGAAKIRMPRCKKAGLSLISGGTHAVPGREKPTSCEAGFSSNLLIFICKNGCGGRIRTYDLQVMSLTSYRAAPPRVKMSSSCPGLLRGSLGDRRDRLSRAWPCNACPFLAGWARVIGIGLSRVRRPANWQRRFRAWKTWRRPTLPRLKTQYHRR